MEECLNDTWFAAWRQILPHRPDVLSAFVRKITRHFAIDSFRKNMPSNEDFGIKEKNYGWESFHITITHEGMAASLSQETRGDAYD